MKVNLIYRGLLTGNKYKHLIILDFITTKELLKEFGLWFPTVISHPNELDVIEFYDGNVKCHIYKHELFTTDKITEIALLVAIEEVSE